ncbi:MULTISPECIES: ABC transporter permease [unclassified Chelatococcus]|uniref:ABC transporter permease n=1 Tax=unclassified Chelatococcus TaxID=2638111 RepID=UPI001BD0F0A2|nr:MULTISPECIES: ABC transporter permease [unclassified Chelatococcus]CAH1657936.1 Dipeptide transport system permease protein DppC [Hyphomicrobiales bacterium]MBS7742239.1 ABC transporter permease [Chelatococcus sp. HY11]MBX3542643.1 ABC transporter permease [Chelatococcus sp.]MCO5075141.1 ABC transporter permease [Chelatococcus sp.]CAH1689462.1 Dipeptide transport system permease protein DppC [Hyphomicrobiales bacterium]
MTETYVAPLPDRRLRLRRALRHGGFVFGAAILLLAVAVAVFAPLIAPYDPVAQNLSGRLLPPAWMQGGRPDHLLGTDHLGRDYLSRLIYGSRVSLIVGFSTMLISGVIGSTLGFIGGYFGGRVDDVITYIINSRLSMPGLLVALAVISLVGGSLLTIVLVLGFLFWDRYAVVVRTATQQVRSADFVAAAQVAGASAPAIIWRQIRPNVFHHILVIATLEMAMAILSEASLSFLGLGIRAPTPSWGLMIAEGRTYLFAKPYLVWIPGIAIFLLVLATNLLGDGLRDLSQPERRR